MVQSKSPEHFALQHVRKCAYPWVARGGNADHIRLKVGLPKDHFSGIKPVQAFHGAPVKRL